MQNKTLKRILEILFSWVKFLLKPASVQRILRAVGIRLPYWLAMQLNYRGIVPFTANDQTLYLQSYNEPIEILIFWYGTFGKWEQTQLKLWEQLVREADVVLDIGANTGVYSLIGTTNQSATVYAFEPVPDVRAMLEENIALNSGAVTVVSSLVGDINGEADMYIPRSGWTDMASMDAAFAQQQADRSGTKLQKMTLPITTVDTFLEQMNWSEKRIVVKIDVEGAEDAVLRGMHNILQAGNIVFTAELLDADYFDTCRALIPNRYRCYAINELTKTVTPTNSFVHGANNYMFTTEEADFSSLF